MTSVRHGVSRSMPERCPRSSRLQILQNRGDRRLQLWVSLEDLASFVLAGFALTGSPGPATLGLAAAGAAFGVWRSLPLMIGAVVGVVAVMLVTAPSRCSAQP